MRKAFALVVAALALAAAGCSHPSTAYYVAPQSGPPAYAEISQHAFHDGFDAARHDMAKGIRPDFDRHQRFRNPPVPPPAVEDYRGGFREGYDRALRGQRSEY